MARSKSRAVAAARRAKGKADAVGAELATARERLEAITVHSADSTGLVGMAAELTEMGAEAVGAVAEARDKLTALVRKMRAVKVPRVEPSEAIAALTAERDRLIAERDGAVDRAKAAESEAQRMAVATAKLRTEASKGIAPPWLRRLGKEGWIHRLLDQGLSFTPDDKKAIKRILRWADPATGTMEGAIDVVFDGPPSAESGRFVECEDLQGNSIKVGQWIEREDGFWALRISPSTIPLVEVLLTP